MSTMIKGSIKMLLLILASPSILAGNQPSIPLPPKPATTKTTHPTSITTIEGPLSAGDRESAGEFVLDFGKHKGLRLREVPREYLKWLKTAVTDKPVCREAVERYTGQMESPGKSSSHDNGPQPNICLKTHEEINMAQDYDSDEFEYDLDDGYEEQYCDDEYDLLKGYEKGFENHFYFQL